MWKISRIFIVVLSTLITFVSLIILGVTIFAIVHYKQKYTFVPWNIMIMTTLTGITGAVSLITGIVGILGGALQRKAIVMVTVVLLIFATTIVTFIGLYSFSGVVYTDKTLKKGWSKMDEEEIPQFEEVWECHDFSLATVNTTTLNTTAESSSNSLPFCVDVLRTPFKRYSGMMIGFSSIVYLLLVAMQIVVSFHVVKGDKSKEGFSPIGNDNKE
ncbi:hypothetical protein EDI_190650 [Entamoeba dispar SAW760]|uniref:Uncharacterized protein n=1 Tax=Entamoeba dispar (strain ATCC PRA-260 / SAW760) TaxID=370354 RepID=B0E633_ENTDS|nr:uncharacterized protein EDI_190650 [Entamoeba dispar SAW760]EDR30006.1 hypothetical protein EDI_190650 [Entamoeba dispar SAW760]|eukprot:EDR30006.1 hypothetical protein EDI_190650 [Entamoeba dispar SAW760]